MKNEGKLELASPAAKKFVDLDDEDEVRAENDEDEENENEQKEDVCPVCNSNPPFPILTNEGKLDRKGSKI